ncbi:glycosyltransferase [Adlercreutzia sp. ZJ242]|uniref:glycosyltransferase family 2 protein n=1 Tax=Adlercreutzia sp. ZJ242 TaxID=2709409 RepID=UPI001981092C|nr:glycosyltransferase [Adlercreutzia sp. ZJ242]
MVLTVYNMEECLAECLESLARQDYEDYEVVCVDDGSTDRSGEIIGRYAERFADLTCVCQENAGPAAARNKGMEAARGEYVVMLDADDLLDSSFLRMMAGRAVESQADVIVCRSNEFNHMTGVWHKSPWTIRADLCPRASVFSGRDMGGDVFRCFAGWPWDKLFRADFIRDNRLCFPDLRNSEDLCFVYEALAKAQRISVVDQVLIHHRTNRKGSVSLSQPEHPADFYRAISILKGSLKEAGALGTCAGLGYEDLERGFLNWALDFALWNVESMPEGAARAQLVRDLTQGSLPELEVGKHAWEFFSLYPRLKDRYELLRREAEGGRMATRRSWGNLASTLWTYVSTLDVVSTIKNHR